MIIPVTVVRSRCLALIIALTTIASSAAVPKHNPSNARAGAIKFLLDNLPAMDKELPMSYIMKNVDLALKAYRTNAWSRSVPWDIFLNEVLPYAVVNEPRDEWRSMFNGLFAPMVAKARSTNEAVQILNKKIWSIWDVVFKGGQTPYIMSPLQVLSAGLTLAGNPNVPPNVSTYSAFASCTGVSIFLVNACRSVGIPARMTGIAQWEPDLVTSYQSRRLSTPDPEFANHNWVEVWDHGRWSFTGASEPDQLNHTWFFPDPARYSIPGSSLNGIWATSFAPVPANTYYPMAWDWQNTDVPGVDVTEVYITAAAKNNKE